MKTTEHEWVGPSGPIKWEHCSVCLIIKRRDGKNKPCKGRGKKRQLEKPVDIKSNEVEVRCSECGARAKYWETKATSDE